MSPFQESYDEDVSVEKQEIEISLKSKCIEMAETINRLLSGQLDELELDERLI